MSQATASPLSGQGAASAPDPSQGTQGDDGSGAPAGIVIYMAIQADGSIQVGMQGGPDDDDADPGDQQDGAQGDDASGDGSDDDQTFTDPGQALQAAGQLLQQALGGSDDPDAGAQDDGDAPMAPADAKSLWNRMATKKDRARAAGV